MCVLDTGIRSASARMKVQQSRGTRELGSAAQLN